MLVDSAIFMHLIILLSWEWQISVGPSPPSLAHISRVHYRLYSYHIKHLQETVARKDLSIDDTKQNSAQLGILIV